MDPIAKSFGNVKTDIDRINNKIDSIRTRHQTLKAQIEGIEKNKFELDSLHKLKKDIEILKGKKLDAATFNELVITAQKKIQELETTVEQTKGSLSEEIQQNRQMLQSKNLDRIKTEIQEVKNLKSNISDLKKYTEQKGSALSILRKELEREIHTISQTLKEKETDKEKESKQFYDKIEKLNKSNSQALDSLRDKTYNIEDQTNFVKSELNRIDGQLRKQEDNIQELFEELQEEILKLDSTINKQIVKEKKEYDKKTKQNTKAIESLKEELDYKIDTAESELQTKIKDNHEKHTRHIQQLEKESSNFALTALNRIKKELNGEIDRLNKRSERNVEEIKNKLDRSIENNYNRVSELEDSFNGKNRAAQKLLNEISIKKLNKEEFSEQVLSIKKNIEQAKNTLLKNIQNLNIKNEEKDNTIIELKRKIASDKALLKELSILNKNIESDHRFNLDRIKLEQKIQEKKDEQIESFKSMILYAAIGIGSFAVIAYYYFSAQGLVLPNIGRKIIFALIILGILLIVFFTPKGFINKFGSLIGSLRKLKTIKNKWNKLIDFLAGEQKKGKKP